MSGAWLREEQADLAAGKILDAAGRAFVDLGVARTRMGHIARYAGCSRGTLYRYFGTREQLYAAYIDRASRVLSAQLAAELADIRDPRERLVEAVVRAVERVRSSPKLAAWFDPNAAGLSARMSHASHAIEALSSAFVEGLPGPAAAGDDPSASLRAHWMVRVIVSLLTLPGRDAAQERALVERFVAPGLVAGSTG